MTYYNLESSKPADWLQVFLVSVLSKHKKTTTFL